MKILGISPTGICDAAAAARKTRMEFKAAGLFALMESSARLFKGVGSAVELGIHPSAYS